MSNRKTTPTVRARRASRTRGEKTRQAIIAATLRVIAREGVRGVTHRAVAREAGVNLSLTTYYFVDLNDLVSSAFQSFMEDSHQELAEEWRRAFQYIESFAPEERRTPKVRARLRDDAVDRIVDYILRKIDENPMQLAIEHHFFFEALVDPRLIELAGSHRRRVLEPMIAFCAYFDAENAEIDADLLFGTITRLEYEALLVAEGQTVDEQRIQSMLHRLVGCIIGL